MRPTLLSLVIYTSRNACLCTKHQNFALKLKTITSVGGKLSINPDTVAKLSIGEISSFINDLALGKVVFFAWKKFDIAFKKGTKELLFGIKAAWNYFNAGRNKGPCDVLGGTIIRMADNAIKQGKYVIQDAFDFFSWAESNASIQQNPLRVYFLRRSSSLCRRIKIDKPPPNQWYHGTPCRC